MIDIVSYLEDFDNWIIIALILVILIVEVFLLSFPKEFVMIYAGLKFGILFGGILNLIGLFGAAWLGYEGGFYGRFGLEKKRNNPVIQKYQKWLERNGLKTLAILRLVPLTPNDILSISSGFSRLPRFSYLSISFVTAIPYAFFFSWVGSEQSDSIIELFPKVFDPTTWAMTFIVVILLAILVIRKGTSDSVQDELVK